MGESEKVLNQTAENQISEMEEAYALYEEMDNLLEKAEETITDLRRHLWAKQKAIQEHFVTVFDTKQIDPEKLKGTSRMIYGRETKLLDDYGGGVTCGDSGSHFF